MVLTVVEKVVDSEIEVDEVIGDPGDVDSCSVVHAEVGGFWKGLHVASSSLAALKASVIEDESLPLMTSIFDAYARSPRPVKSAV